MACLTLGPLIKTGNINNDLAVRSKFYMGPVHGPGSWSFKVDTFVVVPATVAGTLEFVFAGLPIGRAPQVRAAGVDHEQAIGSTVHPNAIFLLELGVDT